MLLLNLVETMKQMAFSYQLAISCIYLMLLLLTRQVTVSVQPDIQPPPHRYFHAACYVPTKRAMYAYGGLSESHYLRDLWSFNIDGENWSLLDRPFVGPWMNDATKGNLKDGNDVFDVRMYGEEEEDSLNLMGDENDGNMEFIVPPPLAGHTLTYCSDGGTDKEILVLIGGISDWEGFLDNVWEYRVASGIWSEVNTTGTAPFGIFGHSTVYHPEDQIFYVYGGYTYSLDKVGMFGELYALHYPTKKWSLLPLDTKINENSASVPAPRAFHTAVSTPDYLLIIGGHIEEQRDLHQALMIYSYKCNMWIPLNEDFIVLAGPKIQSLVGLSSAIHNRSVFVYGGYDGITRGAMMSIQVPEDLCTLRANKTQCRDFIGCANCVVYGSKSNTSHCYSNARPQPDVCYGERGSGHQGKICNASLLQRDCYQYNSCASCLATYPAVADNEQKCKWCRHCAKGKCIPKDTDCASEKCEGGDSKLILDESTRVILDADRCHSKTCVATDCNKCESLEQCTWMQRVMSPPLSPLTLNATPNWNCFDKSFANQLAQSSHHQSCPDRCMSHRSCGRCLSSRGVEGGWEPCYWSQTLSTCLAPSYISLRCLGGRCGVLLHSLPCPLPCDQHTTCSDCLQHPECGWCALDTEVGGLGVCTNGGLSGPRQETCSEKDFSRLLSNSSVALLHEISPDGPLPTASWHYLRCPPEDECRSGHHNCHPKSQECKDKEDGFSCLCAKGYHTSEDHSCIPICKQGCLNGTCVEPDKCSCNFGFVGANCSIKCECNGHSDCKGPDQLTECIKCHNNTMGSQCGECKPRFVGNPKDGGTCRSCFDYCNTHSSKCLTQSAAILHSEEQETVTGSSNIPKAVCQECSNNTTGYLCESCLSGYFRGSKDLKMPCLPCECNGHSDVCDPVWGDKCQCSNNTESPCSGKDGRVTPGKEDDKDCQKKQCSKCKEYFLGSPSNGHQCYYQMIVDKEYCLDPRSQSKCDNPKPLNMGHTVFFAVQPKFMNVNIRLVLDITKGSVNVYFSSRDDIFIVALDKSKDNAWNHKVELDSKYSLKVDMMLDTKPLNRNYAAKGFSLHSYLNIASGGKGAPCDHLGCNINHERRHRKGGGSSKGNGTESIFYRLIERDAEGLKTFVTVSEPTDILKVNNVTNRLVITLPQDGHDLRSAKFYLIIEGKGDHFADSAGSVFFRQDQPRIDLFVFFSVFFSCFFLFLAVCVVVWKIKQNIDHRRARRRQVVEMLHMARRPFAITTLVLQESEELLPSSNNGCYSPSSSANVEGAADIPMDPPPWSPGRRKRPTLNKKDARGVSASAAESASGESFELCPVAIEPTDDGVAAVVTTIVQFPGFEDYGDGRADSQAPSHRLALGSSLCLMSRVYPPVSKPFLMRRRTSHTGT